MSDGRRPPLAAPARRRPPSPAAPAPAGPGSNAFECISVEQWQHARLFDVRLHLGSVGGTHDDETASSAGRTTRASLEVTRNNCARWRT